MYMNVNDYISPTFQGHNIGGDPTPFDTPCTSEATSPCTST
jgi:hypothetical protein